MCLSHIVSYYCDVMSSKYALQSLNLVSGRSQLLLGWRLRDRARRRRIEEPVQRNFAVQFLARRIQLSQALLENIAKDCIGFALFRESILLLLACALKLK